MNRLHEYSQSFDNRIDQLDTGFSQARHNEQEEFGRLDSIPSNQQTDVPDRFGQLAPSITTVRGGQGAESASSHLRAPHAELQKIQRTARQDMYHLSAAVQVLQYELTQSRQAIPSRETEICEALSCVGAVFQSESRHTRQEFSWSLAIPSRDVSCAITPLQQNTKENSEKLTTTAMVLHTAGQDVQHVSATIVAKLNSPAQAPTVELQVLRNAVGAESTFRNSLLMMAAKFGVVSTLCFLMFNA